MRFLEQRKKESEMYTIKEPSNAFIIFSPWVARLPSRLRVIVLFLLKQKRLPRLRNPKTFSDMIQYRKLYDRNPKYPMLVDKIAVRSFVKSNAPQVRLPRLLWVGESLSQLELVALPDRFVLKANNGSGTNLLVFDKNAVTKELVTKIDANWLRICLAETFGEWAYQGIERKVFAEEMLVIDGEIPSDYKFWVFHGRVELIQVDQSRFKKHKRTFFCRDWTRKALKVTHSTEELPMTPPENLDEMIEVAEQLSSDTDFIRVDLYTDGDKIFFGELTLYPGSGYEVFSPYSEDLRLGDLWKRALPS